MTWPCLLRKNGFAAHFYLLMIRFASNCLIRRYISPTACRKSKGTEIYKFWVEKLWRYFQNTEHLFSNVTCMYLKSDSLLKEVVDCEWNAVSLFKSRKMFGGKQFTWAPIMKKGFRNVFINHGYNCEECKKIAAVTKIFQIFHESRCSLCNIPTWSGAGA